MNTFPRLIEPAVSVTALWRPPFSAEAPRIGSFAPDVTIADMIEGMELPAAFATHGAVVIIGRDGREHQIDRTRWHRVRLKPGHRASFHLALAGGGGDRQAKSAAVLGLVIAVATALTAGAAAAGFFAIGGLFGPASGSAQLLAGAISLAGSLASAAVAKTSAKASDKAEETGTASLAGNVLSPGAPIPRVLGTRRLYPPLLAQPLTERIGRDEYVEAVFALAGPHRLEDIRLGDTAIADAEDVEVETREGWAFDSATSLVSRYADTTTPQVEISGHTLDPDDTGYSKLKDQDRPEKNVPIFRSAGFTMADEAWLHFTLSEGLYRAADENKPRAVPLRLRVKTSSSSAWINLPELHFQAADAGEVRATIILKRGAAPDPVPGSPRDTGFVVAYAAAPGQSSPQTETWLSDASFFPGGGAAPVALYAGVEASGGVRNVALYNDRAVLAFDPDDFPAGDWTVEVKRGASYEPGSLTKSSYAYSGSVRDFFAWRTSGSSAIAPVDSKNVADRVYLLRVAAVTNAHPVMGGKAGSNLALIVLRIKNRAIDRVSVKASGFVRDWDGAGWNTWTTTSNPAPHYRDVLAGALSGDPLPETLLDDAGLLVWRSACDAAGWTCDHVAEGDSVSEVLGVIAGCGFASPRASEKWGVVRDRDRSGEDPVQIFTARNSAGLSMAKAFTRLPDALRCVWSDGDDVDRRRETLVWREGREGVAFPRLEEVQVEGKTDEPGVIEVARYMLRTGALRSATWTFRAAAEAVRCERGDLIAINHDMLSRVTGSARIAAIEVNAGAITAIDLDSEAPARGGDDMLAIADLLAIDDLTLAGLTLAMQVRRADGSVTQHDLLAGSGETVRPQTPIPLDVLDDGGPSVREGCLVALGPAGAIFRELVVTSMTPDADLAFTIEAVDAANAIFA